MGRTGRDGPSPGTRVGAGFGTGSRWLLAGAAVALASSAWLACDPEGELARLGAGLAVQALFACTALGVAALVPGRALPRGLALGPPRIARGARVALVGGFVLLSLGVNAILAWLQVVDTGTLREIGRVIRAAAEAGPGMRLLSLLAIGVAPAFGEELLFRGLVQQGARSAWGPARAVLVSSAAFGVFHLDPVQGAAAFVLGLYLGAAAELAGSVRTAVACHLVNNSLAVLTPGLAGALEVPASPGAALALVALGGAVLAAVGWGTRSEGRTPQNGRPLQPPRETADQTEEPSKVGGDGPDPGRPAGGRW